MTSNEIHPSTSLGEESIWFMPDNQTQLVQPFIELGEISKHSGPPSKTFQICTRSKIFKVEIWGDSLVISKVEAGKAARFEEVVISGNLKTITIQ